MRCHIVHVLDLVWELNVSMLIKIFSLTSSVISSYLNKLYITLYSSSERCCSLSVLILNVTKILHVIIKKFVVRLTELIIYVLIVLWWTA